MRPPSGVYLAALASKFSTTCESRTRSPSTNSGSVGRSTCTVVPWDSIIGRTESIASLDHATPGRAAPCGW